MKRHCLSVLLFLLLAPRSWAAEPRVLYEKASPFSTIVVTEDDGLRTLSFERNGARQSVVKVGDPDHLELPYVRAMNIGLTLVDRPRRMLVVGLGGGSIPGFLHKHYPQTVIDAVDIDPDVVAVAKQFFGFREDATLKAHVADGRRFIETSRDPYDVIFLDAFSADSIPYQLATREFLLAVRKAIGSRGVVVANVWGRASNSLYDSMLRTYADVFEEVYVFDVPNSGNKIVVAQPRKGRKTRQELADRGRALSRELRFPMDVGELIRAGYEDDAHRDGRGHVLLDKDRPRPATPVPALH